ncbi:MAG: flagellar basal body-associated FliL family protein [Thermodesulfobacteriota bacterium]|nr:flagellar basal body-associated FliL family protein [Thermodesulfobacteriota bacterium]
MAEEEQKLESPKEEKKKSGKLKWIIILVLLLGLGGGGGYFAYTKFFSGKGDATNATEEAGEEEGAEEAGEEGETGMTSLPTFVVNLADPLGRRYLKLSMDVEVKGLETVEELTKAEPKIRDAVILLLSSKTFADLSTMENKLLLKNEIVERLNQVLGGSKVLRVYFTEMVVQ